MSIEVSQGVKNTERRPSTDTLRPYFVKNRQGPPCTFFLLLYRFDSSCSLLLFQLGGRQTGVQAHSFPFLCLNTLLEITIDSY